MHRVHIFCFAASYTIVLLLELSRLLYASSIRRPFRLAFVGAGWIAHSAFLYYQALQEHGTPLSSYRDWLLFAAWVLVLVYAYLETCHPNTNFGIFLMPLVLGLIVGAKLANPEPFAREPASKVWGAIHGASLLLATVAVLVGFVSGVMYLTQTRRLKVHRPPLISLQLPSLEWLQHVNVRAVIVSILALGLGVSSGVILNLINYRNNAPRVPWSDPLVLGTSALFGWMTMHLVISLVYRPIRQGKKVAYLTVVSFVFLVLALGLGLMLKSQHGGLS